MKNSAFTFVLVALSVVALSDVSWAQSGNRGSGTRSGGAARASSGGTVRRSSGTVGSSSRSVGSTTRLSSAERAELQREQLELQQQQAKQFQEQQAKLAIEQRIEFLTQLGSKPNGTANKKQNSLALEEAKADYKALRNETVAAAQLGPLNQLFRLRKESIDRKKRTANWPKFFDDPAFQTLVKNIDSKIANNGIVDSESAQEFLDELAELNQSLNAAASSGEIGLNEFAKARRFVSGLGNEIRATNLIQQ